MSKVYLDDTILTGIANQTRRLTETQNTYTPAQMATALSTVENTPKAETVESRTSTSGASLGSALKSIQKLDFTVKHVGCSQLFIGYVNLQDLALHFNVKPTTLYGMFFNDTALKNLTITGLDASDITTMYNTFYGCSNLDICTALENWTLSSCTTLEGCFHGCSKLTETPNWNTSAATTMKDMFNGCSELTTVKVYNTSNVTDMRQMFWTCKKLTDQSLDNILQMCINATNYAQAKRFTALKQNDYTYTEQHLSTLPHWQDFLAAGWTFNG